MKKKRSLASCIQEFWPATILTPIFVIGEVAFDVLIPLMTGKLLDEGVKAGSMHHIAAYGLTVVGMAVLALICGGLSGRFGAKASTGFARNLRREMYRNVQKFSFANIDKFSTSGIITRLTTDVTNLQNAYQMIVRVALRSPAMLIFSLAMAIRISPKLSIIFLIAIPILGAFVFFLMSSVHPIFERVFRTYDKLNNVVQENVHGVRVVKAFVREDHEISKFAKISQKIYADFCKAEGRLSFSMPGMQVAVYSCMLLLSWFGARIIVGSGGSDLTTGELMSLMTYALQILGALMMLSMIFVMVVISRASAERIVEVLDEQSDLTNPEHPVLKVADGSVDFSHVSFSYSKRMDKCCLKDIDLHIPSGMTVGILGGTGSSKSSLVQLIPRLYDTTAGTVKVGGVDVKDYDLDTLRNAVAMVLQKNVLFSGTIKENLRWGNEQATDAELQEACRLANADEFIATFPKGYDTYLEQGGANVSGGQKQRLCIARALLKKPKILILDDSTSAVDTKTDAGIRAALKTYLPETTKFIIAQRISSLQDSDLILVLDGGVINGMGTHEELLQTNAIYQEIYEEQTKKGGVTE